MALNKFTGTGVAIVTPFSEDKSIDFNAFGNHIDFLIAGGINYLVVLGTTGETATLSNEEKNAIVKYAVKIVNNRIPIVIGIGGNNTQTVVDTIKNTDFKGIDAILSVAPYYNKPNQKGLYLHYKQIALVCPIPIILYNVPGRTMVNIEAETTLKLARDFDNIIAIKEASGDLAQIMKIIKDKPSDFQVISGDDALVIPILSIGGVGVISVIGNAFPKELSTLVNLALKGDFVKARNIQYQFIEIIESIFADGNPAGIKAVLSAKKLIKNNLRLPLVPVNSEVEETLKKLISVGLYSN